MTLCDAVMLLAPHKAQLVQIALAPHIARFADVVLAPHIVRSENTEEELKAMLTSPLVLS